MARRTTGGPEGKIWDWPFNHHGEVRHEGEGRGRTGDGAHDACGDGDGAQHLDRAPPHVAGGEAHVSLRLVGLGAVADALDELDVGDAVLEGERLREVAGMLAHVVGAAAGDGEVIAADGDGAPVDLGEAHHVGAGGEADEVAGLVVVGGAHEGAGLDEAAWVDHLLDAFADGVAATGVLAGDALGAAHLATELADVGDVLDGALPGHAGLPALAVRVDGHGGGSSAVSRTLRDGLRWRTAYGARAG